MIHYFYKEKKVLLFKDKFILLTVMDEIINKAMSRAVELSIENAKNRTGGPFGCVIIKDGKIISEGSNRVTADYDPTSHAEVVAIRTACKELKTHDLSGCVLVSSCELCTMCFATAKWSRIDKIIYSNTRHDAHDIGFSDLDNWDMVENKKTNMIQLKNDKSLTAFQIWDADTEKIKY